MAQTYVAKPALAVGTNKKLNIQSTYQYPTASTWMPLTGQRFPNGSH